MSEVPVIIQGCPIGVGEVQQVRQLLAEHPDWSRCRLSGELAVLWNWRNGRWDQLYPHARSSVTHN